MKLLPKYPRKLLVHVAVDDRRHGSEKIAEADDAVAVPVEAVEHHLRVFGRIAQREQFGIRGLQIASRRASPRTQLLEDAVQPAYLVFGEASAEGQGGESLGKHVR